MPLRRALSPSLLAPSLLALATVMLLAADAPGLDVAGMDKTVKPGDNFFAYANDGWDKTTEIPADRSSWGTGGQLTELTDKRTAELIQTAGKAKGAEAQKIAAYYAAYMDEAGIEAKGLAPLKPTMAMIAAITDHKALSAYLGSTLRADIDVLNSTSLHTDNLFGLWIAADLKDPTHYSTFVFQGGLSLPNREFYITDTPRMVAIRKGFEAHVAKVLTLAGIADADAKAARILALETAIAKTHWSLTDSEDPEKGNNPWSRADFDAKAKGIDWSAYFGAAGLPAQKRFVVWQPQAVTGEAALVESTPIETWKDYLTFHLIDRNSGVLPKAYVDERFAFYGKTLSGTPQLTARWKRGVGAVNGALGEAVGKLYVAKYFPPSDKAAVQGIVKNLLVAFGKRIDALDWMDPATKKEAHAKLAALKVGVGYPDHWRDYSGLVVAKGDALGNAGRASLFDYHQKLARLGKTVDRGEWVMNPQLVNAVNLPVLNALNFPAAELQPPHFDPKAPAAINYGAVGATIGHEISHSFDNNGAEFDSKGRLRDWWTKADFAHFTASGKALAKQFDGYCPFPDACVKGEQTLSENIADVAGLYAAYDAYRTAEGGKMGPERQGFTGDQQFFISFAQSWRTKTREQALRQQVLTDGHAPAQYRALTVRNLDAWYPAFNVKPGETLYLAPKDRVKVW
jgi:putative endopeptidase